MTTTFFIHLVLYIVVMTLIFVLSAMMLCPCTRSVFKAPVPNIHFTLGKLLIPWGMTYLIFLPFLYLQQTGSVWYDYAYTLACMLTASIMLSIISWLYTSYLQQGVRQRVMQPLILALPLILILAYAIEPDDTLLPIIYGVIAVEGILLVGYYLMLYRRFKHDLMMNYSNISRRMLHGLKAQWFVIIITAVIFILSMTYDSILWNLIDMAVNILAIGTLLYTSEHMMPINEEKYEY